MIVNEAEQAEEEKLPPNLWEKHCLLPPLSIILKIAFHSFTKSPETPSGSSARGHNRYYCQGGKCCCFYEEQDGFALMIQLGRVLGQVGWVGFWVQLHGDENSY